MYPLPELSHGNPCTCSIYCTEKQNKSPAYLWIHLPETHDRVITFDSVTDAYAYGIKYIFDESARPVRSDDDNDLDFWDLIPWTAADGTNWCIPYLSLYLTLCDTLNSIAAGLDSCDDPLLFLTTEKRQLLIGLGHDLPHTPTTSRMVDKDGYTLEHHADQTIDPTIIYMEQIHINTNEEQDNYYEPNIIELPFSSIDIDYEDID